MHQVLHGESNADKLGTIRQSLKEIGYDPYALLNEEENSDDTLEDLVEEKKERWDCETILSMFSITSLTQILILNISRHIQQPRKSSTIDTCERRFKGYQDQAQS